LNASLSVGCGQERVQQAFSPQGELLQPGEELPCRGVVGEYADDFTRRSPLLGELPGGRHVERLCETTGVGDDMDELGEDLWGDCDEVARRQQPDQRVPGVGCSAFSLTSAASRKPVSSP
jgi:hypothetical protein